jgi:uncharacterized membrane protein
LGSLAAVLVAWLVLPPDELGVTGSARGSPLRVGQHTARGPDARGWYGGVRPPRGGGASQVIEFESTIRIDRPLAEVFSFVADQTNNPKWNYFVIEVEKTSDAPLEVGTTFHQTRKADAQDLRVVALDPNRLVGIETVPPSRPELHRRLEFRDDKGSTVLTDKWRLDTGRPQLVERLGAGRVRSAVRENLGKLKELLESGAVTLQDGRTATV